jgi:hypothetical protein
VERQPAGTSARAAIEGPGNAPTYVGDEHRVRQILVNLLSNAIKFTTPGGHVRARWSVTSRADAQAHLSGSGPWVAIEIEDTGIGIAPQHLSAVFEPFVQAERGHTRTHGGTGLGLAISRRLARLMGGDITVQSRLGEGSRFALWLPTTRSAEPGIEISAERAVPTSERRTPAIRLHGLGEIGELLRDHAPAVLVAIVDRLRADPDTPLAKEMRASHLEDHQVTFLADLAQMLLILDEAGSETAALLRDGSAIQRTVAEHHGARRHAQLWTESAVRREFEILREEVEDVIRTHVPAGTGDVDAALGVIGRVIERGMENSVGAYRHAEQSREA